MGTLLAATARGDGKRSAAIPDVVWKGMGEFAWTELWVPESHWVVSLSPKDKVNTPSNLLIRRADWGTGGSYGGIPGMVAEGLASADGAPRRLPRAQRRSGTTSTRRRTTSGRWARRGWCS